MQVVVLGAGVVGVTTAWRLARDGHEVTVVDAADSVATGASAANAGMIAPGHAYPWASPRAPWLLARSLVARGRRLRIAGRVDRRLARWGALFLRECTPRRARRNALAKLRLCQYSESLLHRWAREEDIDYAARRGGGLYLHRSAAGLRAAYRQSALFRGAGREQLLLGYDEVRRREPALDSAAGREFVGAVFDPGDSSGDAARFAAALARRCEGQGVQFLLGRRVARLVADGGRITAARVEDGTLEGEAFVLALGAASASVAESVGERLEIYPVKGYAATFPLHPGATTPAVASLDEEELIAWSVLGDRLRMATGAEFAGDSAGWTNADFEPIVRLARKLFPDLADYDRGEYRTGMRPMTPDSAPVIGRGAHENLVFNTGHGHMGWTMACGSAEIVRDLLADRAPGIGLSPFRIRW